MYRSMVCHARDGQRMRGRLTRAVGWNALGAAFNQGSTFVVSLLVAHMLARKAFGQFAMIQTTLAVVVALAPLSSGYTATKYVAEYRDRDAARAGRVLGLCALVSAGMGLLAALGLLFGAGSLAEAFREPELASALMIGAGVVFFSVMNSFSLGALAGFENYPALGKAGVVSGLSYMGLCAGGAMLWGLSGAVAGAAVTALLQGATLWSLLIREARRWNIRIEPLAAWRETEVLLRFSLPAALNGFVSLPSIWTAHAVLARQAGGFDQMALFTAANSFRIVALFVPNVLNTVGMSILNNQRGAGDEVRFRRLFWANLASTGGIVLLSAAAIAVAGPWLLALFGDGFRPAYPVLLILMPAALAESLTLAIFQVIQTQGRIWLSLFAVVVPSYLTLMIVPVLLAPRAGAMGLAWGYLGCWLVSLVAVTLIAWRLGVWASPDVLHVAEA
jgi:O-antigen/teichoic acid export membrane protein